jgi:hypothetical protein
MKLIANILFILGFCVATIGGAGFADSIENGALPLFLGGLVAMLIGGLIIRRITHAAAHEEGGDGLSEEGLIKAIREVRDQVHQLDGQSRDLNAHGLAEAIDKILRGPCFDLGARNEAYMRVLGNAIYVRHWEGFAVGERLLARAWSMAADGAVEQSRAELPKSLREFQRAAEA